MGKKSLPKFRRQEWFRFKRLGEKWRKPRGRDSKLRIGKSGRGPVVSIGYRVPKQKRGLHPSGMFEILVKSKKDIEEIDPQKQAVRIGSSVGGRKREQILARANELKIRVLNPGVRKHEAERKEKASG